MDVDFANGSAVEIFNDEKENLVLILSDGEGESAVAILNIEDRKKLVDALSELSPPGVFRLAHC